MVLRTLGETGRWAKRFAECLQPGDVVFLRGPLGVGKTTLAQSIAQSFGIVEPVTSPTYTIINEYSGRLKLVHMDLYRLSGPEEFELVGGWDAIRSDCVTLIEWPERLDGGELAPTWQIELELLGNARTLLLQCPQGRSL